MDALTELNGAVKSVIDAAAKINDDCNKEVWEKAPIIVHQKFAAELVRLMKQHPDKTPMEVPEAAEIITAFDVLEKLYPQLTIEKMKKS